MEAKPGIIIPESFDECPVKSPPASPLTAVRRRRIRTKTKCSPTTCPPFIWWILNVLHIGEKFSDIWAAVADFRFQFWLLSCVCVSRTGVQLGVEKVMKSNFSLLLSFFFFFFKFVRFYERCIPQVSPHLSNLSHGVFYFLYFILWNFLKVIQILEPKLRKNSTMDFVHVLPKNLSFDCSCLYNGRDN